jgi:hypothetical protein
MATQTTTSTELRPRKAPKGVKLAPENERYMRACADIASALIQDHEAQANGAPKRDISLNVLRGQIAKKHYLPNLPPLTAIIAAVPEHYKKYILPKLIAKPIRMSKLLYCNMLTVTSRNIIRHRSRSSNVQTSSMSAYFLYWKHLCLLPWRTRFGF